MKKTFTLGQLVLVTRKPATSADFVGFDNSWVARMDPAVGQVGVVEGEDIGYGVMLSFKDAPQASGYQYPAAVLELAEQPAAAAPEPVKPTGNRVLTQTIVNTKGQLVTVRQERDALGRFIKGAQVNPAGRVRLAMGEMYTDPDVSLNALATRVIVQYSLDRPNHDQMVTVLRFDGTPATCKTFLNDGESINKEAKKLKTYHNDFLHTPL